MSTYFPISLVKVGNFLIKKQLHIITLAYFINQLLFHFWIKVYSLLKRLCDRTNDYDPRTERVVGTMKTTDLSNVLYCWKKYL